MRLLLLANTRVMFRGAPAAVLLVLFALVAGFVSSYLYYGNVPVQRSVDIALKGPDVEQFRFVPVLDLTDAELAEMRGSANSEQGAEVTVPEFAADPDAHLEAYYSARAGALEARYGFHAEQVETKSITDEGVHYDISVKPSDINRPVIVEGSGMLDPGDVLITEQHARLAGLVPGGSLQIGGESYRIAGTYVQPGISLVDGSEDTRMGNAENAGLLLNQADFDAVGATPSVTFAARSDPNGADANTLVDELRKDSAIASVTLSSDLPSMSSLPSNLATSLLLLVMGSVLFLSAIALVIWQVTRNNLRRSIAVIGAMAASGFHPMIIATSFLVYVVPVVVGVGVGAILGFFAAPGFQAGYLATFNIVIPATTIDLRMALVQTAIAFGVPAIVGIATARALVTTPALRLLDGSVLHPADSRTRRLTSLVRPLRMRTRVRLAFALSNLPRLLVVVLSAATAVLVLAFSLAVAMMATRPLQQLQEALEYGSVVQYAAAQPPPPAVSVDTAAPELSDVGYATQLHLMEAGNGAPINRTADVLAVDPSFSPIRVTSSDGASLFESLTEEGIIVSAKLAADVNLAVGDTVHVRPQAQPERIYTVIGINPIDMDTRLYVSSASLPTIVLHAQAGSYTSWFAPVGAHPTSDASTNVTTRSAIVDRAAAALSASLALVPVLVTIGVVLACGVLFLIAYLNVFDNRRELALLDQLGYEPRHASRLVINVYGGFLVAGAVAGAIATPLLLTRLSAFVSSASQYRLDLATDLVQLAAIIALVASLAQVTQFLVLPWVRRVSPAAMSYS